MAAIPERYAQTARVVPRNAAVPMIFCPQDLSLELLERRLTDDNRALAERLLEQMDSSIEAGTACHNLLIGPRGSGKTHVLSYVRKRFEAAYGDGSCPKILWLSEDDRGITSLLDFLVACLRGGGVPVEELITRVRGRGYESNLAAAQALFRELTEEKPTVIVVENLSDLFDALEDSALARVRTFFQDHPFVSVCASSVTLFGDSSNLDHPFYDFFMVHSLGELDRIGARKYLFLLAQAKGDEQLAAALCGRGAQKQVDAIYDLTRGNHRILAMLSCFVSFEGPSELVTPFMQLVDWLLIPYYQRRLDRLSRQQSKIFRVIAAHHGRALSVNELSRCTFLSSQTVSRQLYDLLHRGYVARHQVGRESCYELSDPLLRLVLDAKEGHGESLERVLHLLRVWHEVLELRQLEAAAPGGVQTYLRAALAAVQAHTEGRDDCLHDPPTVALGSPSEIPEAPWKRALGEGLDLDLQGKDLEALEKFEEVIRVEPDSADGWLYRGFALMQSERGEAALEAFDTVTRRFGASGAAGMSISVAVAMASKAIVLAHLGRLEEAMPLYDEIMDRVDGTDRSDLAEVLAEVLANKCVCLERLQRYEEALVVCNELVVRLVESARPELLERVALALVKMGVVLVRLGRTDEAIAAYDEVQQRFGESERPELRELVALALTNKASALRKLGDYSEALETVDRALGFRPGYPVALCGEILVLMHLHREQQAMGILRGTLTTVPLSAAERVLMARLLLGFSIRDRRKVLGRIVEAYEDHKETLLGGLIKWLQDQLPMSDAEAEELEKPEETLRSVFGDIAEAKPALELLRAVRRHAMGDRKALFELPVELRRLVQ